MTTVTPAHNQIAFAGKPPLREHMIAKFSRNANTNHVKQPASSVCITATLAICNVIVCIATPTSYLKTGPSVTSCLSPSQHMTPPHEHDLVFYCLCLEGRPILSAPLPPARLLACSCALELSPNGGRTVGRSCTLEPLPPRGFAAPFASDWSLRECWSDCNRSPVASPLPPPLFSLDTVCAGDCSTPPLEVLLPLLVELPAQVQIVMSGRQSWGNTCA
jgi:hypothetical protein